MVLKLFYIDYFYSFLLLFTTRAQTKRNIFVLLKQWDGEISVCRLGKVYERNAGFIKMKKENFKNHLKSY